MTREIDATATDGANEVTVPAGEFKAKCLKLMDQVARDRRPIVITKRGKPVTRLVPAEEKPRTVFGHMRGTINFMGDIVGPTGEQWNADRPDAKPFEE